MKERVGARIRRRLSVTPPLRTATTDQPRAHTLLEQRSRPKALSVGLLQNLLHLEAQAGRRDIHQFERPDRVTETELAGCVDVLGRGYAFLDQANGLDDERMQDAIDR